MVKVNLVAAAALAAVAWLLPTAAFPQDAAAPTEIAPATPLPDVPRNQTLILGWSITSPIGVTNPWAVPGYTHQEGNVFMWEPLMYFGIFKGEYIPWLAESMEYTSRRLHLAADQAQSGRQVERRHAGHLEGRRLHVRRADEQRQAALPRVLRAVRRHRHRDRRPDRRREVQDPGAALQVRSADPKVRHRHPDRSQARPRNGAGRRQRLLPAAPRFPHSGPYDLSPGTPTRRSSTLREDWWARRGRPHRRCPKSSASSSSTSAARSARTWTPWPSAS